MFEYLGKYWYLCPVLVAAAASLWYQSRRGSGNTSLLNSLRNNINRHENPKSPLYDPGLLGRQLRLLVIGLPLIAVALFTAWFIQT